jgi:protein required for attachment to host cells
VDRIRKKYPQNLPGEESEQIESYEETVAKDDLPNESMKKDKAMEFDSNKEISDNVHLERKQILDRLAENFARIVFGHNISSVDAWHL